MNNYYTQNSQIESDSFSSLALEEVTTGQLIRNIRHEFIHWLKRRQTHKMLSQLSDRQLKDIGWYREGANFFPLHRFNQH
ncbi:DUF1127 domain-containing protein [Endozoicomonas sp. SM1973]|uniref:DUF1127 domain-containing protein n=1 Tax=Spartinivicinus marinus TaxID=2994442 RepID=A0A853I1Q0_9GAMM|nr:DUF1127 domain-containing protein [Spartinivicinus marinus]MCX4026066.1 DUF1127 domain-containing protein [Spartinivicinus marinus]NYZ66549.1 DUF1127 domain-containing protein [Spartinivicinus marinus]